MKVELLIFFSIINNPSRSVNNSNSTLHLFNAACNDNPGAARKQAGSRLHVPMSLVLMRSYT